jgi:hypothetical protein
MCRHRARAERQGAAEGFDGRRRVGRGEVLLARGEQVPVLPVALEVLLEEDAPDGQRHREGRQGQQAFHARNSTGEPSPGYGV